VATRGTARELIGQGLACEQVDKVNEGRPDVSDMLKNEQIDLIINTTEGRQSIADSAVIRRLALSKKVCYTTTLTGGEAFSIAIRQGLGDQVTSLQQLHSKLGQ
jgi:carbamoyl-phosphate synthase large subunit